MPCRTGTFAYLHTQKPAFHAKSRLGVGTAALGETSRLRRHLSCGVGERMNNLESASIRALDDEHGAALWRYAVRADW